MIDITGGNELERIIYVLVQYQRTVDFMLEFLTQMEKHELCSGAVMALNTVYKPSNDGYDESHNHS